MAERESARFEAERARVELLKQRQERRAKEAAAAQAAAAQAASVAQAAAAHAAEAEQQREKAQKEKEAGIEEPAEEQDPPSTKITTLLRTLNTIRTANAQTKTVVFSQFTQMLDKIEGPLTKVWGVHRTGRTSDRKALISHCEFAPF